MTIRITVERLPYEMPNGMWVPKAKLVKEFKDEQRAARWFIEDSYFTEPHVWRALWERIPEVSAGPSNVR